MILHRPLAACSTIDNLGVFLKPLASTVLRLFEKILPKNVA